MHRLEKAMIQKNRNFEEFMDFRDMIQGDALDDRMQMVQYMSKKPVMAMDEGGSLNAVAKKEEDKRIAKVGDSLAEVYVEAAITKNPNMFDKYLKQQTRMSEGADLVARGLASMPVAEASFGGFVKDLAIDIGKSVVGDIAGEFVGGIAESIDPSIADALGTTAGKAIFGAGTNALLDYGLNEVFDYGAKPDIYSFGTDVALRGFADYMATPEDERAVFGELFLDKKDADEARKIAAIRKARLLQAEARGFGGPKRELAFQKADAAQQKLGGSRLGLPKTVQQKDFLSRVADYSRLDEAVKDPTSKEGLRQIGLRSLEPVGRSLFKAAAVPEGQQAQPQGMQSIQPSRFVPRLSREVGGLRGITVPAKVDRNELNQRQITELGTKGFTIHKGKRITKQDLVGRTEFARRTKPLATAATGGLISLRDNGGPVVSDAQKAYMNWLDSVGGPSALSKRGLQRRTIDEVITPVGPEYFSYDQGDNRGAGLYDDFALDMADFPFAYPEHPDFRRLNALGGGPRAVPPTSSRRAQSIQTIAPSDSNREFVLRLLGLQEDDDLIEANQGGSLMADQFSGMVGGDGHGMEDNVQMPIVSDGEQVATLAVSPKEYVVDAYTMSALGNGNADEGAKIMDETIKSIRRKAYGTNKQPNEIDGSKALRSGLRSIA
jgi:hypothetical protein